MSPLGTLVLLDDVVGDAVFGDGSMQTPAETSAADSASPEAVEVATAAAADS